MDQRPLIEALEALEVELARVKEREKLGKQLKAARKVAGWSQSQMAEASGVTQEYISQVENGHRTPSTSRLNCFYVALKSAEGELHAKLNEQGRAAEDVRKARN